MNETNNRGMGLGIIVLLVIVAGAIALAYYWPTGGSSGTSTSTPSGPNSLTTPWGVSLNYPISGLGLATTPAQILVTANIPPCDANFNYCFYYNGDVFKGTNFDSAGLRILKRTDLTTERLCLDTPPAGLDASTKNAGQSTADTYATSVFVFNGAAAGHTTTSALYRLFTRSDNTCTELEARIAETQFANYPAGTIKEFTDTDAAQLAAGLEGVINSATVGGVKVAWPTASVPE